MKPAQKYQTLNKVSTIFKLYLWCALSDNKYIVIARKR